MWPIGVCTRSVLSRLPDPDLPCSRNGYMVSFSQRATMRKPKQGNESAADTEQETGQPNKVVADKAECDCNRN